MPLFTSINGTKLEIISMFAGVNGAKYGIDHFPVGIDGTTHQIKLGNRCDVTIVFQNALTTGNNGETSMPGGGDDQEQNFSIAVVNGNQYSIPNNQRTTGESSTVEKVDIGNQFQIDVRTASDATTEVILNGDTVFDGGAKVGGDYNQICVFRADGDLSITIHADGKYWSAGDLYLGWQRVTITGAAALISVPEQG